MTIQSNRNEDPACDSMDVHHNLGKDLKTNRSHTDPFAGVDFPPLYPNGVEIASKKYNDLQALLEFVPPVYQDFYKGLRHVASEQDRELLVPPKERGHLGEGDD